MEEKTAELRDIFTTVTDGEETVTEAQEDTRGSLEQNERSIDERLSDLVSDMRDRYGFETPLTDEELRTVARGFYDDVTDAEVADELSVDEEAVFEARCSLHLVDETDVDGVDLPTVRETGDDEALAETYDVDESRIGRYRRIADALAESRAANDRYRDEFDTLLGDSGLSERMATNVREDGLEDATEGMETDVSF